MKSCVNKSQSRLFENLENFFKVQPTVHSYLKNPVRETHYLRMKSYLKLRYLITVLMIRKINLSKGQPLGNTTGVV